MAGNSSQDNNEIIVLVCKHLLDDAELHWVHHQPNEKFRWALMCEAQHQQSDMAEAKLVEALESYPEIKELLEIPKEMDVSFKKGKNSGKWYDFHRS